MPGPYLIFTMAISLGKNPARTYGAYDSPRGLGEDGELTRVGRGPPAGELMRRY